MLDCGGRCKFFVVVSRHNECKGIIVLCAHIHNDGKRSIELSAIKKLPTENQKTRETMSTTWTITILGLPLPQ
jgi:hypothetical protein